MGCPGKPVFRVVAVGAIALATKVFNPFYRLVVVAGMVFSITACSYGVLTVKMLQPAGVAEVRSATGGLLPLLDRYGLYILLGELAVLALFTFAAIGTDDYWIARSEKQKRDC